MTDITESFGTLYQPFKAIVLFREQGEQRNVYIESYDMDTSGCPYNAHPLSVKESQSLAKALQTGNENEQRFLQPIGLLPKQVLYLKYGKNGFAVWHTPAQKIQLLFKKDLNIPCGVAAVPSLIWQASREHLYIYALKSATVIGTETPLYHAPFFNIYSDGRVCMGSVNVEISADCSLENFIGQWQQYFFGSYFSHLITDQPQVKMNIVQLWQSLVNSSRKFPTGILIKNNHTIKNLIR